MADDRSEGGPCLTSAVSLLTMVFLGGLVSNQLIFERLFMTQALTLSAKINQLLKTGK